MPNEQDPGSQPPAAERYSSELDSLPRRGLYFVEAEEAQVEPTAEQMVSAVESEIERLAEELREYLEAFRALGTDSAYHRLLVRIAQDDQDRLSRWAHEELQSFNKTERYRGPLGRGVELEKDKAVVHRIRKMQSLLELRDRARGSAEAVRDPAGPGAT